MSLKGDGKFIRKLTHLFKNDVWNLLNFHASSRKSEYLHVGGLLLSSTGELCLIILKSDAKFEQKPTLGSKNNMKNLVNFNARSGKSENLHFDVVPLLQ